ncbi:TrkA family potassium uptake protein [Faecalimonas umbilicata]|nr:TrkA family potassium uptake protein [Faecalimonas umbilicata]
MKKQFAVFGLGNFGISVAITLQNLGCEVVVADGSMERIQEIADSVSYAVKGDITDPELMHSIGTRNLDGAIIAISENMEASIMATMLAKEEGVPYVLAKAQNEIHATILRKIGADAIVYPEREMGARVAKNLVSADFADWITLSPECSVVETAVPKKWIGRTLRELDVRKRHDVSVVGYTLQGKTEVNPDPDMPLQEEMILILIGTNLALREFGKE